MEVLMNSTVPIWEKSNLTNGKRTKDTRMAKLYGAG